MTEATEIMVAPVPRLPSRKLSMWLFLGSEVLFFSSLIFTYIIARATSPNWPSYDQVAHVLAVNLTAFNTFVLICSSVSVVMALEAIQRGNQKRLVQWLAITLVLGCFFLSVQAFEYRKLMAEGLTPFGLPAPVMKGNDPLFGTTFYTMTGFHGMHVLGGVLTLLIVFIKAMRGHYTQANHDGVELFGLYWHFVDLVWIILFTIVYLI